MFKSLFLYIFYIKVTRKKEGCYVIKICKWKNVLHDLNQNSLNPNSSILQRIEWTNSSILTTRDEEVRSQGKYPNTLIQDCSSRTQSTCSLEPNQSEPRSSRTGAPNRNTVLHSGYNQLDEFPLGDIGVTTLSTNQVQSPKVTSLQTIESNPHGSSPIRRCHYPMMLSEWRQFIN